MIELIGRKDYGGWYTETSGLNSGSVVYSFGVGFDISWDLEMIRRFGCTLYAFDPTDSSAEWLKKQSLPAEFVFRKEGISTFDGDETFYLPLTDGKPDFSTVKKGSRSTQLPVKTLQTLMKERGHAHIDVLKMDIEGSEYNVLPDIVDLDVRQILVEIHQRFFTGWKGLKRLYGRVKTKQLLRKLRQSGFEIVHKHDIGDGSHDCDYLFMKRS